MNILEKSQLHLVKPMFRQIVTDAWERGENVPFEITILSDVGPTENELQLIRQLNAKYKWEIVENNDMKSTIP